MRITSIAPVYDMSFFHKQKQQQKKQSKKNQVSFAEILNTKLEGVKK